MYKPNYQKIIILILIIIGLIFIGIFISKKGQTEILGATCPSVVQAISAKCSCPEQFISIAGCTDGIVGTKTVHIKDATNIILNNKNYKIIDITSSAVKSTEVK